MQGIPGFPFPSNVFHRLPGEPEVFQGQMTYIIPPVLVGVPQSLFPVGRGWKNLQRKVPWRHPDQMPEPPQLAPFNVKEQRGIKAFYLPVNLRSNPHSAEMSG